MVDMETGSADPFKEVRRGLLEFIVLRVIAQRAVYAADILATLEKTEFATQEGTLYPLLSKLRRESTVDYEWVESLTGPPRKYYRLTKKGIERLKDLKEYWETLHKNIKSIGA